MSYFTINISEALGAPMVRDSVYAGIALSVLLYILNDIERLKEELGDEEIEDEDSEDLRNLVEENKDNTELSKEKIDEEILSNGRVIKNNFNVMSQFDELDDVEESDNNEQESNEDESDNQDENSSSDEDTKKQSESSESSDGDHSD